MPDLGMFAGDGVGVDSSPTYYCKRPHEFVAADSSEIMCALSLVAILVFSLVVVVWGWDIFYESWVRGRTTGSLLDLPSWVAELPVPLGFSLLSAQAICELITLWGNETVSLGSSHE